MVAYTFNLSTQKSETERSLRSRPTYSIERVLGQPAPYRKIMSQVPAFKKVLDNFIKKLSFENMLGTLHFYLKSKTSVFQNCANCTFTIKKQIHSCLSLNSRIQTKYIFSVKIFLLTSFLFSTSNWCLASELTGWKS